MGKNRLGIAAAALVVLLGLTVWQFNAREAEDRSTPTATVELPKVEKEALDTIAIKSPEKDNVKLAKKDGTWRLVEPVDADADENAVTTALDKLAELEVTGVAATKAKNHEVLEVTDDKGVRVTASAGGKPVIDLLIGKYRSGNTMVRQPDSEVVATVKGSIKFAFNKEARSWRHREISKLDSASVTAVDFDNENGQLSFVQEGGQWKQAEGQKPIADFDANKVKSIVGSASNLRAVDFAAPDITPEQAGLGEGSGGTLTLTLTADAKDGGVATQTTEVFRVGNKIEEQYYAMRQGDPTIYRISGWVGQRMLAGPDEFVKKEEEAKDPSAAAAAPAVQGLPPGLNLPEELKKHANVIQVPPKAVKAAQKPAQ